ncbi:hypothetical protein [Scleromatobacter humisilvae]|uniref:Uncharacterized protein n=1 Tax=Scleromatobacter humisilvae TaxID=2897159 RepID=A0A9X1YJD0_9BURK|nr:hypothetical protein [Scleromatobacter humisilvae]MCK9686996.1 hypothetical protein [Scleromatobacter humisilvae]
MNLTIASALAAAGLALALTGCASPDTAKGAAREGVQLQKAVEAPLADLNLVQEKIPGVLEAAVKAPYALPSQRDCPALANEVRALDGALGADLDTPPTAADPGLLERSSNMAGDAANDALQGAAQSVIPFRGWVRKLDGAERHSKEVAAAIAAGSVRRAFLKGVGQTLGCRAPAAPLQALAASAVSTAKN